MKSVAGGPGSIGASPVMARHENPIMRIKGNPLGREELALLEPAGADQAVTTDHALPGYLPGPIRGQIAKGIANHARLTATPNNGRDVTIGGNHRRWYLSNDLIDALIE